MDCTLEEADLQQFTLVIAENTVILLMFALIRYVGSYFKFQR